MLPERPPRTDFWGEQLEKRMAEVEKLRQLGYKDSEIDKILMNRARGDEQLVLGETVGQTTPIEPVLHSPDAPDDPNWPTTPDVLGTEDKDAAE